MTDASRPATSSAVRQNTLVVDLLGDLNRRGLREYRLKVLIALAVSLGVPAPTMRVTLGRLRERGWFDVRREGRESVYRLSVVGERALGEGGRRLFRPASGAWTGEWSMIIATLAAHDRGIREELRRQLKWLGYAPLAASTWICPHPRGESAAEVLAALPGLETLVLTMRTTGLAEDRALAQRCWDVELLAEQYRDFLRALRAQLPAYRRGEFEGSVALAERIRLVTAFRALARQDPHFPEALQPAGWSGGDAHRLFVEAHELLSRDAQEHLEAVIASNT